MSTGCCCKCNENMSQKREGILEYTGKRLGALSGFFIDNKSMATLFEYDMEILLGKAGEYLDKELNTFQTTDKIIQSISDGIDKSIEYAESTIDDMRASKTVKMINDYIDSIDNEIRSENYAQNKNNNSVKNFPYATDVPDPRYVSAPQMKDASENQPRVNNNALHDMYSDMPEGHRNALKNFNPLNLDVSLPDSQDKSQTNNKTSGASKGCSEDLSNVIARVGRIEGTIDKLTNEINDLFKKIDELKQRIAELSSKVSAGKD